MVVINKIDSATLDAVAQVVANVRAVNPHATVVKDSSPAVLSPGPSLVGKRVLVVEDGPTITHGGMPFGAGTVAARQAGATDIIDPRPFAVGSLKDTFIKFPSIGPVLPAMGYSPEQVADLEATIGASRCDVVVVGSPFDLGRIVEVPVPLRRVSYSLSEVGEPSLEVVLAPLADKWMHVSRGFVPRLSRQRSARSTAQHHDSSCHTFRQRPRRPSW